MKGLNIVTFFAGSVTSCASAFVLVKLFRRRLKSTKRFKVSLSGLCRSYKILVIYIYISCVFFCRQLLPAGFHEILEI